MGATNSKEEQLPNGHEKWLVVDKVQDSDDKFLLSEQEDPVSEPSEDELPNPVSRLPLRRPCDLEPKLCFTPMPSIVEESLSSIPASPPHTHTRSPSGDSQPLITVTDSSSPSSLSSPPRNLSRRTSLDSPPREQSYAASLDSRTRERLEHSLEEMVDNSIGSGRSLELRSDLESFRYPSSPNSDCSGRLPSEGFQLDAISSSTFQGSPAEGLLMEIKKIFRDDGFLATVRFLQNYIDTDVDQEVSKMLLHEACSQTTDVLTFSVVLMNCKAMVNHQGESLDGYTPLHVACSYLPVTVTAKNRWLEDQQKTKIQKLLGLGCDCTLSDKEGNTPLHLATFHNNAECVKLILQSNPNCIDIANNLGNTALHIASRDGLVDVVCVLLEHGPKAVLLNRTKKQRCPLHQAVVKGHLKVVEALLRYDPKLIECADGVKRMQPLHLALKHHSPAIAFNLLSQQKCPVTSTDVDGRTPLHYVCEWGHLELVGQLLKISSSSSYLNATDSNRDTALHLAYRSGKQEVVALLKSKNASKKIVNKALETPKQAGINAGHIFPSKKSLRRLFQRKSEDHYPKISSTDSLLSSTSSTTTLLNREPTTNTPHV